MIFVLKVLLINPLAMFFCPSWANLRAKWLKLLMGAYLNVLSRVNAFVYVGLQLK
jgi:hypothetical protein